MSATATVFAETGHGILTAMSTRPRSPAGDPMTLGNMRANGVRSLDVSCWQRHHRTILNADPWPDHVPVPTFGARIGVHSHLPVARADRLRQTTNYIGCQNFEPVSTLRIEGVVANWREMWVAPKTCHIEAKFCD
jgi:hypothetical protein